MRKIILLAVTFCFTLMLGTGYAVKRYGENFCADPRFTCVKVKRGDNWTRMFPDPYQREVVKRLNRTNMRMRLGTTIAVPKDLRNLTLFDIAPFPARIPASDNKVIVVDPKVLAWGAYDEDGRLLHWGPMSGGKNYCRDIGKPCRTISGNYIMFRKDDAGCRSRTFPVGSGGAPMPYCMFFHGGYALHASKEVPGYHASHGCVRIFKNDARWLNEKFIDLPRRSNDFKGTQVFVNPYI